MDVEPAGAYQVLVVRLEPAAAGAWVITVEGALPSQGLPLAPGVFTIRFWDGPGRRFVRGTLRREGDPRQVPFQIGGAIGALLHTWLGDDPVAPEGV